MPRRPVDFSALADVYRPLEFLFFGRGLEKARFHFLPRLHVAKHLLVLGDGDGRCLQRLLRAAPGAQILSVDSSAAMLERASRRISAVERQRVIFEHCDASETPLPPRDFDGVVTCFFLDCFDSTAVAALVDKIKVHLAPGARWLWVDFAIPARGWRRWRTKIWVGALYPLFGYTTGLSVRTLPPSEELLRAAGFALEEWAEFQHGLIRAAVYRLDTPARVREA